MEYQENESFYALKVGNSWVYKSYKYNSETEKYDDTGVIDRVSIIGTEEINDNLYYNIKTITTGNEEGIVFCNPNGESFELLRESEGNLIKEDGTIIFTNNIFEERLILEDDWGSIFEILIEGETNITVEAGEFNSIHAEKYAILPDGNQSLGKDRTYYSDGIGLVSISFSLVTNPIPTIIRRLDSFELQ